MPADILKRSNPDLYYYLLSYKDKNLSWFKQTYNVGGSLHELTTEELVQFAITVSGMIAKNIRKDIGAVPHQINQINRADLGSDNDL